MCNNIVQGISSFFRAHTHTHTNENEALLFAPVVTTKWDLYEVSQYITCFYLDLEANQPSGISLVVICALSLFFFLPTTHTHTYTHNDVCCRFACSVAQTMNAWLLLSERKGWKEEKRGRQRKRYSTVDKTWNNWLDIERKKRKERD